MLYFPILSGTFPSWLPLWGGESFEFFRPVFNLADFSISFGVITILVFQNKLLHSHLPEVKKEIEEIIQHEETPLAEVSNTQE
jgi:signal peptidase II